MTRPAFAVAPRLVRPAPRSSAHGNRGAAAVVALVLVACGGGTPARDAAAPSARDPRTAIERRRDTACDQLGPKLTACAVEDARADLAAGRIDQRQFDLDAAPAITRKNTEKWEAECKAHRYSSRQVRVLEVCFREEQACDPLLACLAHLNDGATKPPRP